MAHAVPKGLIIDRAPLEPHRWSPPRGGLAPLDASTRELLRALRRRETAPLARRPRLLAWLLVAALHALFALVLWHETQPGPPRVFTVDTAAATAPVLQVRFIPRRPAATAVAPAPPAVPPPRPVREPARADAMRAEVAVPAPATSASVALAPQLFDRNGMAQLPPASASTTTTAAPGYVQRKPTGDMQVMAHRSPLPYKATRFEQYFPPPGENAAQAGLRKVARPLFKQHAVNLPHGVHLKCSLLGGCSDPPAPPPPNDGDERLSMAPAAPLAKDPHPPAPPSLQRCIAAWRSEGPLPYGCPTDTPARAVEEEVRQCIATWRAGKRLPTWCPADTARRAREGGAPAAAKSAAAPAVDPAR
ncbi:hypothetical protein [Dyella sp.]|uniref:hypothetical protein n=1 Tax=Dyella sp. TaxID=1869338 RepID=UPI002D772F83|nr:hypothetical protein [Dyella sp.]HET6434073.1 hypothetical protein [Dyella sp.]